MNQSSNLNEFVEIAQKKSPSFVIVAFNSAWWIVTQVTLSHLKELKLFIILKLLTIKFIEIYPHLVVLAILPLQMKTKINRNSLSLSVINLSCVYEFQSDKGGTKI